MATRPSSVNKSLMVGTTRGLYFLPVRHVNRTHENTKPRSRRKHEDGTSMTQMNAAVTGGHFLSTPLAADDMFIREDLTDEQRMFGQTALEFIRKEVLPNVERLYKHDW